MVQKSSHERGVDVIEGEFSTDGRTFIFRLAGTPLSGVGNTPAAAFDDLMRADASAGGLPQRLRELARDQQGETVRATVIRIVMVCLIVFGVVGGSLVVAAALLPRVVADATVTTADRLSNWIDKMPPSAEERISKVLQRLGGLMRGSDPACQLPGQQAPGATK
jgi:hypothetical protein